MVTIIADGLSTLYVYKASVIVFFITVFGIGFYSIGLFVNHEIDVKERMLISIGVGSILVGLIFFPIIVLSSFVGFALQVGGYAILLFAVFALLKCFWAGEFMMARSIHVFVTIVVFFFLLVVRLAFLNHILLPPYSDSPIHYQIINGFLNPDPGSMSNLSLHTVFSNYYHFGFHSLTTWLTSTTGFGAENMISFIGQLFLVVGPISVMSLIYTLTNNISGALFAGLLAAVGWLMPAYSVNWGKFPALVSIAVLPAVVSLTLLLLERNIIKRRWFFYGLILGGITFIHTRIAICLFFIFASFFIVGKLQLRKNFGFFQSVRFTFLFLLFMWPLSRPLIDFYNNLPVLITILILIPFAFQSHPSASLGVLIFLAGLSLAMLIPNLFDVGGRTLLDRQFLTMILYLPLSLVGGLGFGGLIKKLASNTLLQRAISVALVACVFINLTPRTFLPDRCCNYFQENDRLAFQWIQENSSTHTLYFISTVNDGDRSYGTDAGIWISALTKIPTNKLLFNVNWNSINLFDEICPSEGGEAYVYMGGKETSFEDNKLAQQQWITSAFQAGEVKIYKISSCTAGM
ncbi:MAG TPA: hypothetical protein VK851_11725 [Anaerolineales bacterium]|nr:hypothetical protein [Anaerolineales bacterium]